MSAHPIKDYFGNIISAVATTSKGMWITFKYVWAHKPVTVEYPEVREVLPESSRSRLFNDAENCIACTQCATACPVDCISLQATEDENGRRYPEFFRINFSRCIFCGYCEEACPTYAIQLIPDFEMAEYNRQNLVYEKEDLLIDSQGKYPGYNYYKVAGLAAGVKGKGEGYNEEPPVDIHSLLP